MMQAELKCLQHSEYRLDLWSDWFEDAQLLAPEQVSAFFQLSPCAPGVDAFLQKAVPGEVLRMFWGEAGVRTCTYHLPISSTHFVTARKAA